MPKSGASVTIVKERDFGWKHMRDAAARVDAGGGAYVVVGVQGSEGAANVQDSSLTYAQLARIHEFGTSRIPKRSFLKDTIEMYDGAIAKREEACGRGVLLGKLSIEFALEILGEYVVGLVRQRIADGIMPPLSPVTIKRKGSSKPLIDTGGLRAAITHRPEVR